MKMPKKIYTHAEFTAMVKMLRAAVRDSGRGNRRWVSARHPGNGPELHRILSVTSMGNEAFMPGDELYKRVLVDGKVHWELAAVRVRTRGSDNNWKWL